MLLLYFIPLKESSYQFNGSGGGDGNNLANNNSAIGTVTRHELFEQTIQSKEIAGRRA
jgi:hypothetical protein